MHSLTIYSHKSNDGFRIVAGEHNHSELAREALAHHTVTVYQGGTVVQAAQAALAVEKRADIRAQIARFLAVEDTGLRQTAVYLETRGLLYGQNPVPADHSTAGDAIAPASEKGGGTYRRICAHPAGCELPAAEGSIYCEGCGTDPMMDHS